MRVTVLILAIGLAGCARQVSVSTTPQLPAEVSLRVTNGLDDAVNVYVVKADQVTFVGQVGKGVTQIIPLHGLTRGVAVTLRATRIDGAQTYSRDTVLLDDIFDWTLP